MVHVIKNLNTMKQIIKIFLLHVFIATLYFSFTYYFAATHKNFNPIGTGLQQVVLSFMHLFITIVVCTYFLFSMKDKKVAKRNMLLNIVSALLSIILFIIFDSLMG